MCRRGGSFGRTAQGNVSPPERRLCGGKATRKRPVSGNPCVARSFATYRFRGL